ncbi:MAG: VOC family protein [Acidimicrobiia bacterium]
MNTSLYAVTFDCQDAARLAAFWSEPLGAPVDEDPTAEFASIGLHDAVSARPHFMFIRVPEPKGTKNRVHLDLVSSTREADIERLLSLGATRLAEHDEYDERWTTLADPEGNEFDVVAQRD